MFLAIYLNFNPDMVKRLTLFPFDSEFNSFKFQSIDYYEKTIHLTINVEVFVFTIKISCVGNI